MSEQPMLDGPERVVPQYDSWPVPTYPEGAEDLEPDPGPPPGRLSGAHRVITRAEWDEPWHQQRR